MMFAAVRVRGSVNLSKEIKDTLTMLRLERVNHCIIVDNKNPHFEGMLKKTKNYITWGEIDNQTLEKLVEKKGRLIGNKKLDAKQAKDTLKVIEKEKSVKNANIKPVFRLTPPTKGFKSIRKPFPKGALGYRGDKINILLKRMI